MQHPIIKAVRLSSIQKRGLINARLLYEAGPQGTALFEQVLLMLRLVLNSALIQVFLIGLGVALTAFIINLFIKDVPLREVHFE